MRRSAIVLVATLVAPGCSDSDSGADPGGECSFVDESTGLCWQEPPSADAFTWDAAKSQCAALGLRLPKVQELASLLRGCAASSACGVSDPDCAASACRSDPSCNGCPATAGCYWDASLTGTCDWYWTSSAVDDAPYDAWFIYFQTGSIDYGAQGVEKYVRCVR